MKIRLFFGMSLCLLVVLLGGCRSFEDVQLADNVYKVCGRGNHFTTPERLQDRLLRHCAELTLSAGYKYFAVLNENSRADTVVLQTPATIDSSSSGYYNPSGNFYANSHATINPGSSIALKKYTSVVIVKMFKTKQKNIQVFDAEIIYTSLDPHYKKRLLREERRRAKLLSRIQAERYYQQNR